MTLDQIIDTKYPEYRSGPKAGGKDGCGYFPLYEKHLPKKVDEFIEIGVAMGISIWMFRDYYESKGNFHALNYMFEHDNAGVIGFNELRGTGIICHNGYQEDIEFLNTIKTQFDVIVEDGSHRSDHQAWTFKHMFVNNLKPGGLYVLEDLHCCLGAYWWGTCQGYDNTMLSFFKSWPGVIDKHVLTYEEQPKQEPIESNQFFTADEMKYFKTIIKSVYLYSPSIAFIYKK